MRPAKALVARLALLGASLLFSLAVAEVGLRLAGFSSLYGVYSKPSLFWVHDEALGWSHQPGAVGRYVGPRPFPVEFDAPIEINSLGLRGPEVGSKAPDELRLLFLGDSVLVGFEVANEDTFVARLEANLARRLRRPVRAINAGVRGYGTDQSLLYYRERGRALEADVVLLVHSGNDPIDNVTVHRARRPFGKPAFAQDASGALRVVGRPVPIFPLCSAWMMGESGEPVRIDTTSTRFACFLQTRLADHSATFSVAARLISRFPTLTKTLKKLTVPAEQQEDREASAPVPRRAGFGVAKAATDPPLGPRTELTTRLVLSLAEEVERDGAEFRLLISKQDELQQFDLPSLRKAGIDARLMTGSVDGHLLHWKNDGHLNEAGHRQVADLLARGLTSELRALGRASGAR